MAFYAQLNFDLTKAQIDAGSLEPGTIYNASDDSDYFVFVKPNGNKKTVTQSLTEPEDPAASPATAYSNLLEYTAVSDLNNFNQGDVNIVSGWRISTANNYDFTGIQAPTDTTKVITRIIFNESSGNSIKLKNNSTLSTAGNRIYLPNDADYTIQKYQSVSLIYMPDFIAAGTGGWIKLN